MSNSKKFQDVEYSRVDLDSPEKKFGGADNTAFVNMEDDQEEELLAEEREEESEKKSGPPIWRFEYYQQFFDVDSGQVVRRIVGSMVPYPSVHLNRQTYRPKPDLYGPFWVCTTLIFTIAIAGNLYNYIEYHGKDVQWRYDFKKVTFAATAIYGYWWVVPIGLWALLWLRSIKSDVSFVDLLCIYGYSLTIYVPISFLWLIPLVWLQWLLVMLGMVMSGSVLLLTLWPTVKVDSKRVAILTLATVILLHCALALGFMLYFFHAPEATPKPTAVTPSKLPAVTMPEIKAVTVSPSVKPK